MKGTQILKMIRRKDRQGGSTPSVTWHLFACGAQADANTGPMVSFARNGIAAHWNASVYGSTQTPLEVRREAVEALASSFVN